MIIRPLKAIPKHAEGQDFYNDGYNEDEADSLNDQIVFLEDCFYGRNDKLQRFHSNYEALSTNEGGCIGRTNTGNEDQLNEIATAGQ